MTLANPGSSYRMDPLEQRSQICVNEDNALAPNFDRRNFPVGFSYFRFAYGTNGTSARLQAANIYVVFSPFGGLVWLLIAVSSMATVTMFKLGGSLSPMLDTLAALLVQSREMKKVGKVQRFLVPLFLLWSLFSLLIAIIYSEFMEGVLAVPALVPRIENFKTLAECGYRPVVNEPLGILLNESFRGYTFTDALVDSSDLFTDFLSPMDGRYMKYLAGDPRRCGIMREINSGISAEIWLQLASLHVPNVTWSFGKDKIAYSPINWSVFEPNAAGIYRIFGILHSGGFIQKFTEYAEEKLRKFKKH